MNLKDRLPLKVVAEELGVSRTTLWRAANGNISSFPKPEVIRRLVYWRKQDMEALEAALLRFEGRCAFERSRERTRKVDALSKERNTAPKRPHRESPRDGADSAQLDLF